MLIATAYLRTSAFSWLILRFTHLCCRLFHVVFINFATRSVETSRHTHTVGAFFNDVLNWHPDTIVALDGVLGTRLLTRGWSVLLRSANAVMVLIIAPCWSPQNLVVLTMQCVTKLMLGLILGILCIAICHHLSHLCAIVIEKAIGMVETCGLLRRDCCH